jgi:Holliday junction resolvase RusA-like endonuclease
VITFFVPGIPKSSQTGSVVRLPDGRAFPKRRNTAWGDRVALVAMEHRPPRPLTGPVCVNLAYRFFRPASLSIRERPLPAVAPDIDNLLKHQLDALNGILWESDAQIVRLTVSKDYSLTPGLAVTVLPWPEWVAEPPLTLAVTGTE